MKRRDFIRAGSAVSLPVIVNGFKLGFLPKSAFFNMIDPDSDRVLVLIQLDGGNDGLSTLIPLDQYANLSAARSSILIPENSVLPLTDETGLHPGMTGMRDLFDEGKLVAVQNVAYPNQNRSHFRSTDIWSAGSSASQFESTGWLGRYFNMEYPDYPDNYPNEDNPDPFAITVRTVVSETCQGPGSNYSMALTDPFNLNQIDAATADALPDTSFGHEMEFLIASIAQTNAYTDTILAAANAGANLSPLYEDTSLAQQLRTVALLISGGLQTRVYVVRIGGFDTHANQADPGSPLAGRHAELLTDLSSSIAAFQDDLKRHGLEERVLGMTFSEFGRQIASNDSLGTDHGTAAPLFLFGSCVKGGVIGQNPQIPSQLEPQAGVAMEHDYRSIYATVLKDWFGASEADVQSLLFDDFEPLPLLTNCADPGYADNLPGHEIKPDISNVFPNPLNGQGNVRFDSEGGNVRISLNDQLGREVRVIADRNFVTGRHVVTFDTDQLPQGSYFIRLTGDGWQKTHKVVKL